MLAAMTRRIFVSLLIGGGILMASSTVSAQDRTVVIHGIATPGGGFPVYGAAFAETINETDPSLEVRPTNEIGTDPSGPAATAGAAA